MGKYVTFHGESFDAKLIVTHESCLDRVNSVQARRNELIADAPHGLTYAGVMAHAWKQFAEVLADEAGEPHPEFRFLPKGSKPVDELWEVANQIERDREKLEAQIGEYAYAMRAAVAWGNLREALRSNQ